MRMNGKIAKSCVLAGIPFLALPLVAESGMSRDRSHGGDSQRSTSQSSMDRVEILRGEIFRKDGKEITLRQSHGERVSFRITDQTNQLCPKGTSSHSSDSSQQSSSGSPSSMSSSMSSTGQESSDEQSQAQQRGFTFGDCNLQNGDFIKAKVDQNGDAIFVRSMGYQGGQQGNYFQSGRMGDDYFVLPAGQLGGLDISDKESQYTVKSSDGEQIGDVYRIMTNNEGDLTYAIVRKNDGQLISVPWQAMEGAGNQSFKLNVTKNQVGTLPILEEGENTVQHVQRHWDLSQEDRKDLAQWNEDLDQFYQTRDRFYEDTPTFRDNREGYDRYDRSRTSRDRDDDRNRGAMRQSRSDRQGHYQDQRSEGFQTRHYGFSPQEFPAPERAPQFEGANQGRSSDRNRQSSVYDYDYGDSRSGEQYPQLGSRAGVAGERGRVSIFGSPSTLPPGKHAPQYEGADQGRFFDRNAPRRSFQSQGRERNYDDRRNNDRYQTTTRESKYDPQRRGADRYQARGGNQSDYDYRPDIYRP